MQVASFLGDEGTKAAVTTQLAAIVRRKLLDRVSQHRSSEHPVAYPYGPSCCARPCDWTLV